MSLRERSTLNTDHSSILESMKIDRSLPTPLHIQVAGEIRRAIIDGEIKEGERMPPAIDLASVLGVNKNTVFRALRELRDEGLLDVTRGRGVRVVGTPSRGALVKMIEEVMRFAQQHGYRKSEVIALIKDT